MKLRAIPPKVATKELLRYRPLRSEIDGFKTNLIRLLGKIDEIEREENQKTHVRDFLLDTYYRETNEINTKNTTDLVIHLGKTNKDNVGVIFETKRPGNKSEMLSVEKPNVKALHELVLYYMRERIDEGNIDIKNCVATNIYQWFIFDAQFFEKYFAQNKAFVKDYKEWRDGKKVSRDTSLFFNEIAKPYIEKIEEIIPVVVFDIRDYNKELRDKDLKNDKKLIALYKAQSPYHLLRKTTVDSNALNDKFYKELLYILGLEEIKEGSKNIIRRRNDRFRGALIENVIAILEVEDLYKVKNVQQFGETKEEQLYNIALELALTWINRILFLKLLEGQLIKYHKGNLDYRFLNHGMIHDFDELYKLFHHVLARKLEDRHDSIREKYNYVPYLNSSLFEITELEDQTIRVNALDNSAELPLMPGSILADKSKKSRTVSIIQYVFQFLDAYDFASEGEEDIQEDNRSLINASVLGKVFEKINGYRDGSIYTPGHITMYMCRETIRMGVVNKFNERYGWNCETLQDIYNQISDRDEANKLINSLRLCDPAVGSGHFLVSALNEILAIKYELGILHDETGKRIKDYNIEVINDELVMTDEYGDPFIYNPRHSESQRIQKALFHEKQAIIENCLFGVDLNTNSVKICRLRLWIELLKHAYYKEETGFTELETLPNIDINIKAGNSLISRYALDSDLTLALKNINHSIPEYKEAVNSFKNETDRAQKRVLTELIQQIKNGFQTYFSIHDERREKLSKARGELVKLQSETLFEKSKKEQGDAHKKTDTLTKRITTLEAEIEEIKSNVVYQNAFEWRIEFPEVLDNDGNFVGFDIIIGNPPYIQLQKLGAYADILQQQGYETFVRTGDIYCLFYELGINLLKSNGLLCYITSNKWMKAAYGTSLRRYLLSESNPLQLFDFSNLQLFDAATVNTNILVTQKATNVNSLKTCLFEDDVDGLKKLSDYFRQKSVLKNSLDPLNSWIILSAAESEIKKKIEDVGTLLKDWDVRINYGIKTGYNEAFIINDKIRNELIAKSSKNAEIIRPILKGRNIKKYQAEFGNIWLLNTHNGLKNANIPAVDVQEDYPTVFEYLQSFETALRKRLDQGNHWTNLRNCAYLDEFEKEKIVWLELTDLPKFSYDDSGIAVEATAFFMTGNHIKYLLGFLNSRVSEWYFSKITTTSGVGTNRWKKIYLENLPIPIPTDEMEAQIIQYIDNILSRKARMEPTIDIEEQIDSYFFNLYNFGEAEIKLLTSYKAF